MTSRPTRRSGAPLSITACAASRVAPEVVLARHRRDVGLLEVDPAHHHDLADVPARPRGRAASARATLVSGPIATIVSSPGSARDPPARSPRRRRPSSAGSAPCTDGTSVRPSTSQQLAGQPGRGDDVAVAADRGHHVDDDAGVGEGQREGEAVVDVRARRAHRQVGVEDDPQRLAHSRPRSVSVRTSGWSRSSSLWPIVETKTLPLPHWRVHTAGQVTCSRHGVSSAGVERGGGEHLVELVGEHPVLLGVQRPARVEAGDELVVGLLGQHDDVVLDEPTGVRGPLAAGEVQVVRRAAVGVARRRRASRRARCRSRPRPRGRAPARRWPRPG